MNIFIRELKANRKALLIWCVCMFLGVVSGMSKYTAYSAGGPANDIFKDMPYSLKALLGIGSFDVTTMSGFFAFLFLYLELALGIHAVLLGAGIIAKEERDKTTEFLMTRPVSRAAIITSKLLAALVNIIVLNLVTYATSIFIVAAYNKGDSISAEITTFFLSLFIVQFIFLSAGTVLAAVFRNPKASGSLAAGVLLVSFIITKVTDLTDKMNYLNVLSPFKYFSYADIVAGKGLETGIVAISLLLSAAFTVSTYFAYRKRDLSI